MGFVVEEGKVSNVSFVSSQPLREKSQPFSENMKPSKIKGMGHVDDRYRIERERVRLCVCVCVCV